MWVYVWGVSVGSVCGARVVEVWGVSVCGDMCGECMCGECVCASVMRGMCVWCMCGSVCGGCVGSEWWMCV